MIYVNVLSVKPGTIVTGEQINDWYIDQVKYRRSHWKEAIRLLEKNYKNDVNYVAVSLADNTSGNAKKSLYFMKQKS